MAGLPDSLSAFDDAVEVPNADLTPLAFPLTVAAAFGEDQKRFLCRAFEVHGGGNIVVKTAAGKSRTFTGISNPFFYELKISEITSATAATKVRFAL